MAVELPGDAQDKQFDAAIIPGAGPLPTPVHAAGQQDSHKRMILAFPPNRNLVQPRNAAPAALRIVYQKFKDISFPDRVSKPARFFVRQRLPAWR